MKNKHLVFLFIVTLLVGLAIRRAPWQDSKYFQTNLLKLDTASVQQIQVALPGQDILYLLRNDAGWSAEQGDRSINLPQEAAQKMLSTLADLRSIRIAKTSMPDTLGFSPATAIQISIIDDKTQSESLTIGWETIENSQAASFVNLPKHGGIYLVNDHLRNVFSKTLTDFRNRTIVRFAPSSVQGFCIFGLNMDSLLFQKNDITGIWEGSEGSKDYPNDSIQIWFAKIAELHGLQFADLFDESRASDAFYAKITLLFETQLEPLTLTIFHWHQQIVPEVMDRQKLNRQKFANFVLHSSQNPANYFALNDTLLLQDICWPFLKK
ncbi:MAG: DUF4340 domain-containing protein [Saprospiraceae bacterium]